mmetsp:Transcript_4182/g.10907  ORF Transcript_4182/g.10907 Transcript_4182/m.10907 type:complete len:259 (+) Transcript_4182:293-1069(+)
MDRLHCIPEASDHLVAFNQRLDLVVPIVDVDHGEQMVHVDEVAALAQRLHDGFAQLSLALLGWGDIWGEEQRELSVAFAAQYGDEIAVECGAVAITSTEEHGLDGSVRRGPLDDVRPESIFDELSLVLDVQARQGGGTCHRVAEHGANDGRVEELDCVDDARWLIQATAERKPRVFESAVHQLHSLRAIHQPARCFATDGAHLLDVDVVHDIDAAAHQHVQQPRLVDVVDDLGARVIFETFDQHPHPITDLRQTVAVT